MKEKDKEEIRQIFAEEFNKAHFRKVLVEYGPRKQGDPEKKIVEEEWNVMDWLVKYIPYIEGALRGLQEDVDKTKNKIITQNEGLQVVAQILIDNEQNLKQIAKLSKIVKAIEDTPRIMITDESDTG